jgi:hypothetical protein
LTLKSKSHEGHYGMQHTALWSCTHIPNIIDLSGMTKKLWSGQASSIYKSWAEEEQSYQDPNDSVDAGINALWLKCWCPLLQGNV